MALFVFGLPVDVLKSCTTSTQFEQYRELLNRRWNERTKLDHQLADLTFEVHLMRCAMQGQNPTRTLEDCYQKFRMPAEEKDEKPLTPEQIAARTLQSQMAWKMAAGYKRRKPLSKREATPPPKDLPPARDRKSKHKKEK